MTSPKISDVFTRSRHPQHPFLLPQLLDSNTSTQRQRIPLTLSLSRLAGVYHPIFLLPLSTHSPSHPGPLAASVNKGNDEFVAAVVPEAIESLLDASFAALGTSCKADTARVDTSTMEGSCSNADTTIVFGDVENPRITILGSLGVGVIIERLRVGKWLSKDCEEGGRSWKKEGERQGNGIPGYLVPSPSSPMPTPSRAAAETLENPRRNHQENSPGGFLGP
uniref:Uncharacterized protein n=1 Tax=Moniliophthora roreri TaxID=221103 RepID=A0A0W0GE79_MONRR